MTNIRREQIKNNTVQRKDLNTTVSGKSVVTKIILGSGLSFSSTGIDAGTGDVTINRI